MLEAFISLWLLFHYSLKLSFPTMYDYRFISFSPSQFWWEFPNDCFTKERNHNRFEKCRKWFFFLCVSRLISWYGTFWRPQLENSKYVLMVHILEWFGFLSSFLNFIVMCNSYGNEINNSTIEQSKINFNISTESFRFRLKILSDVKNAYLFTQSLSNAQSFSKTPKKLNG